MVSMAMVEVLVGFSFQNLQPMLATPVERVIMIEFDIKENLEGLYDSHVTNYGNQYSNQYGNGFGGGQAYFLSKMLFDNLVHYHLGIGFSD